MNASTMNRNKGHPALKKSFMVAIVCSIVTFVILSKVRHFLALGAELLLWPALWVSLSVPGAYVFGRLTGRRHFLGEKRKYAKLVMLFLAPFAFAGAMGLVDLGLCFNGMTTTIAAMTASALTPKLGYEPSNLLLMSPSLAIFLMASYWIVWALTTFTLSGYPEASAQDEALDVMSPSEIQANDQAAFKRSVVTGILGGVATSVVVGATVASLIPGAALLAAPLSCLGHGITGASVFGRLAGRAMRESERHQYARSMARFSAGCILIVSVLVLYSFTGGQENLVKTFFPLALGLGLAAAALHYPLTQWAVYCVLNLTFANFPVPPELPRVVSEDQNPQAEGPRFKDGYFQPGGD